MSNKVVLVGLWFALSLTTAISQDVKGQTSAGTVVPPTTTTTSVQQQTTPNLITSGTNHTWTGATTGALPANYMPGGPAPIYDPSTNTISFSYNANAYVGQAIAVNQALSGTGVKINGYNYSYDIRNMNGDNRQGGTDTLLVAQALRGVNNSVLLSSQQYYNTKFDWQTISGSKTAANPINLADATYLQVGIQGGDNGYWGGYFGPQVRNMNMSLNYTVDPCVTNPQSSPACPGFKTFYNIGDDGYAQVNLPFTFPFYGRNFTTSYMFSNGVVGFLDPTTHGNGFCCDGVDLRNNPGSPWNFAIYALQTDLIAANPDAKFYTQSDSTYMKYTWEKINEYGTNNLNTFSTTIRPSGYIGINHQSINVQNHNVTVGIAGDISLGQYSQHYTGAGISFTIPTSTVTYSGSEVVDYCASNPLYSPTCPLYTQAMCASDPLFSQSCSGYAEAYFNQQCSLNQMYNVGCPGYAQAYLNYQCSLDPLYSTTCQGYDQAYHDQQCRQNPLYATDCTGYAQAYHDQQCSTNPLYATTCTGYARAYHDQQCSISPLYATDCRGYAAAYLTQQCSINPLYSTDCAGYQQAYFNQQCSLNPLYNSGCSGYAQAYKAQQCSLNALYATDCPGYETAYFNQQCSLNPLYNSRCAGYEQAYFNQQCSLNPLYNSNCTGYTQAYHDQQCSLNALYASDCSGYAAAYKTQQCTANPLYASDCAGYDVAYKAQQCGINALYATDCPGYAVAFKAAQCTTNPLFATDCPGYATAYFNQQCSLNGLYDRTCPNYAEAYAKKMVLEQQGMASTIATAGVVAKTAEVANANTTTTSTSDGSSSVAVAVVADPVVNQTVTSTATSTSPAAAATATVSLLPPPPAPQQAPQPEGKKDAPNAGVQPTQTAQGSQGETKPAAPTARQELQAKREAAAKAAAVEKGKNLAKEMGKVADMEQQKQVQNVVIQAMGFTPGFDAYGKVMVPDGVGYKPFTVYKNQVNVDNRRLGMGLYGPSDRLHNDLVNSQYKE